MKALHKGIIVLALLLCTLLLLSSCDGTLTLEVRSTDYDVSVLTASELNDAIFERHTSDQYNVFYSYVSVTNSYGDANKMLVINNERDSHLRKADSIGGYFVGLDHAEFASGIYFIPCSGSMKADAHKVSDSRCVGLFDGPISGEYCYAITAWNAFGEEEAVKLCKLISPIDGACDVEIICDIALGDAIACTRTSNSDFYVITESSFYSVTTDGIVTKIQVPSQWRNLQVTSIVEIENMIYIGTKYGVLEYSILEDEFVWFPVEYEKAVN